jgi:hypothetical protein
MTPRVADCIEKIELGHRVEKRRVELNCRGGDVTTFGGVALLDQADRLLGLSESIAQALPDSRDPTRIKHTLPNLIRQRVYAIALGQEDLNDHEHLRHDAAIQTALGTMQSLASPSTLCRFEGSAEREFAIEIHRWLLDCFIRAHPVPPRSIILDFDGTDDRVHGEQQGRHYNAHYGGYCFFPLQVYCGDHLLVSYLRSSDHGDTHHSLAILKLLVDAIRQHWPQVSIVFRGDCGFYQPRLLSYCEANRVGYIVGFGSNSRLKEEFADAVFLLAWCHQAFEEAAPDEAHDLKVFRETQYKAGKWKTYRRVIAKLEHNEHGANQRYIVTNLPGDAEDLYCEVYCQRGDMENRHKEQQMGLFSDRTSCQFWWSNQLRMLFSALAYVLMHTIRRIGLAGTSMVRAQVWTIRRQLLIVGAVIRRNTRRIEIRLSSAFTRQTIFMQALARLADP